MFDARVARSEAIAGAGLPAARPPFAWHDADGPAALFAPLGFAVTVREADLPFSGASPQDYIDTLFREHPLWIASRALLEPVGAMPSVRVRTASSSRGHGRHGA